MLVVLGDESHGDAVVLGRLVGLQVEAGLELRVPGIDALGVGGTFGGIQAVLDSLGVGGHLVGHGGVFDGEQDVLSVSIVDRYGCCDRVYRGYAAVFRLSLAWRMMSQAVSSGSRLSASSFRSVAWFSSSLAASRASCATVGLSGRCVSIQLRGVP